MRAEAAHSRETGYLPPLPPDQAELGALRFRAGESARVRETILSYAQAAPLLQPIKPDSALKDVPE